MNKVFQVIYSEARNGYVVVSELAGKHGRGAHSSGRKSVMLTAAVLSALASFSWADLPEAQAAERTEPLTVTQKDQVVADDLNVSISDGKHDAAVDIPASAGGGKIQVNASQIRGTFTQPADEAIMEANGVYIHGDYTGTVQFADGLQVSTTANGKYFNADCMYLTGVENSYDNKGNITKEKTDKANEVYEKSGKIAEAYGIVGKNTTLTLTGKPVDADFLNIAALESHFAHMTVGDGLNVSVTTGPAKNLYVSGLNVMYYGQIELGKGNTITVQSDTGGAVQDAYLNGIYSSHDHPGDIQLDALGKQTLKVGDDTNLIVEFTSFQENKGYVQNVGAFLSNTDFTFGNRLTIQNEMKGSGAVADNNNPGSIIEGILVQSSATQDSQGALGDEFTDRISLSDGHIGRMYGVSVAGHGKEASLGIGNNSSVALTIATGNVNHAEGYLVSGKAQIGIGNDASTSIAIKGSTMTGDISGIEAWNGGTMKFGTNANISITADNQSVLKNEVFGACVNQNSNLEAGDGYTCHMATADNQGSIYLLGVYNSSNATLGSDAKETLKVTKSVNGVLGHDITAKSTLFIGDRNQLSINIHGEGNMRERAMTGTNINTKSTAVFGNDGSQNLVLDGIAAVVFGNRVRGQSSLTLGNGQTNTIQINGITSMGCANFISEGSRMIVGDNMVNSISLQRSSSLQGYAYKLASNDVEGANLSVGNGQTNIISAISDDSTVSTIAGDILSGAPDTGINLKTGSQYTTTIHSKGNIANVNGMYAVNGAKADIGDNARIDIQSWHTGSQKDAGLYGVRASNADISYGRQLNLSVEGKGYASAYGVLSMGSKGKVTLGDDASIHVQSDGKAVYGVMTSEGGKTDFAGGAAIQMGQDQDAICSTGTGSSVTAMGNGRKVILGNLEASNHGFVQLKLNTGDSYMVGDLKSAAGGSIQMNLDTSGSHVLGDLSSAAGGSIRLDLNAPDAYWRGKSTVEGFQDASAITHDLMATAEAADSAAASGDTELTVANGARWDMTGTSQLTTLTHENGGVVNMAYNPELQRLDVGTYSGNSGIFRMKSDLNELETAGNLHADKVYINDASVGSTGLIQVHDESFLTGHEVTGTKYQLLVTDASGKATFSGLTLDEGGLWDVTPTIENGSYVHDVMGVENADATQWYLTKLEKTINKDTKPLLGAADYAYGSYRMDIETLRQRMGELRFLKDKKDESGIWARMYGGEFDGPGYDSRYHALQLGYDYAANPKSFYGFFGERGVSSPHYDYGTSSNHLLAAGVYGTWFGDSGVYTDAVAKWGRDDVDFHTFGSYPDQVNYRTRAASLSLEYGKTMKLNDKGLFLEPQAQLVYGHLGSTHYTTVREKQVHMDDYDSFIGRVGFVFGRRTPDAEKPLDYYLRLSALHEFGGRRGMHLSAADGETMDWSRDYDSTWYEASLGGTYRLNDRTTLYGDVQRSFGSDWHKKWQGNIGINWQF